MTQENYTGPVVQEDFCKELHSTLRIWRPDTLSPEEVIKYGVNNTRAAYDKLYSGNLVVHDKGTGQIL